MEHRWARRRLQSPPLSNSDTGGPGTSQNEGPDPDAARASGVSGQVEGTETERRPISLTELLLGALAATTGLERAWGDALRSEPAARARDAAVEAWRSVFAAVQRVLQQDADALEAKGLGRLPATPLPLQEVARFRDEGDEFERARRYDFALLFALQRLVRAVAGLRDETVAVLDPATGETVASWWDAGGLLLVRSRAAALARVFAGQAAAVEAAIPRSAVARDREPLTHSARVDESLGRAASLVSLGFHDAALPFLLASVRARLVAADELKDDTTSAAVGRTRGGRDLVEAIRSLELACARLGVGDPPDAGVSIPLAETMLDVIARLRIRAEIEPREDAEAESSSSADDARASDADAREERHADG
jgi:hypothetical protein